MACCCMSLSLLCRFKSQQRDAQRRDHGLLVGADYMHCDGSRVGRNARCVPAVRVLVDLDSKKVQTIADALAHGRSVLSDAAGKYQGIHAAECRGERTD